MINRIKSSPELILAFVSGIIVLIFIILVAISFVSPSKTTTEQSPLTIPTDSPTKGSDKEYPQATPQIFAPTEENGMGSLVVTGNPAGMFVSIDPPILAEAPSTPTPSTRPDVPPQYPPFTIKSLPAGKHILIAAKPGFVAKTIEVVIQASQKTNIHIELNPTQ